MTESYRVAPHLCRQHRTVLTYWFKYMLRQIRTLLILYYFCCPWTKTLASVNSTISAFSCLRSAPLTYYFSILPIRYMQKSYFLATPRHAGTHSYLFQNLPTHSYSTGVEEFVFLPSCSAVILIFSYLFGYVSSVTPIAYQFL